MIAGPMHFQRPD